MASLVRARSEQKILVFSMTDSKSATWFNNFLPVKVQVLCNNVARASLSEREREIQVRLEELTEHWLLEPRPLFTLIFLKFAQVYISASKREIAPHTYTQPIHKYKFTPHPLTAFHYWKKQNFSCSEIPSVQVEFVSNGEKKPTFDIAQISRKTRYSLFCLKHFFLFSFFP